MSKIRNLFVNHGRPAAERLGSEPVNKLLISMAIPSIVAMLMQALYNTVDSMFVSRISEGCFAAVTLAFPVQMIIGAMSTGAGVGINSSISRHLGAGEKDDRRGNDRRDGNGERGNGDGNGRDEVRRENKK